MHELGVVKALVEMADEYAAQNPDEPVAYILVEIGEMTGIVPRYVRSYYPDVIEGTRLQGSEIKIEEAPALAFCRSCGKTFNPVKRKNTCPFCKKQDFEIIDGKQFLLKQIAFLEKEAGADQSGNADGNC